VSVYIKREKELIHLSLTYFTFRTGIGPEVFAFASSDGNYTGGTPATAAQIDFYNKHGYYITAPDYILRPEVLESNFYAWRVTGDSKYLERAEQAIKSFEEYCKVENNGYAGLINVDDNSSSRQMIDDTESFWFGEVLKYLYVDFIFFIRSINLIYVFFLRDRYLTFDDPNKISLDECKIPFFKNTFY
jgi:mannosyl-oligosaccharide alpha-1,2-mannosidase